ncbi:MAG: rhomboid family intramembrane serine protease [Thaumarchaeota archaeon]|nr:rhomboid family intramembrane serine protease [Nitrososphaerota archaeon]
MVSKQGRNLALGIVGGLVVGLVSSLVSFGGVPLTYLFLQDNSLVYRGWYWQLFTSLLVVLPNSLGVVDVLFNALAVVWLDGLLSDALAPAEYYAVFVTSGLAGNLFSLLNGPREISFGASGGIFGLLAGAVALDYAVQRRVNYSLLSWFLLVFVFSSFGLSYVDWLAHLGGALFGLSAGYVLGSKRTARLL